MNWAVFVCSLISSRGRPGAWPCALPAGQAQTCAGRRRGCTAWRTGWVAEVSAHLGASGKVFATQAFCTNLCSCW